jgi:hypothetical protein
MNNEKQQTAVEWFMEKIGEKQPNGLYVIDTLHDVQNVFQQAKEMQQEQAQLYATFVLMCVNNNLPPITFNDWVTNIRR